MIDEDVYREIREAALLACWNEMAEACEHDGWSDADESYHCFHEKAYAMMDCVFSKCPLVAAARKAVNHE